MFLKPLCAVPDVILKTLSLSKGQDLFPQLTTKTVRVMKITTILLFAVALTTSAGSNAQKITLSKKNANLQELFVDIYKQTGYTFAYNNENIRGAKKVTIKVTDAPLDLVLAMCFKEQPFTYEIVDKIIVVKQKAVLSSAGGGVTQVTEVDQTVIDITGRVTDSQGLPLAGASVKVKGTTLGTTTNADGAFTLKGVDENATLIFSYAEHETVELKLSGRTTVTAALKRTEGNLQEVVINKGYYTTSQKLNTGSVSKVSSSEIQQQPISNPLEAIAGRMAGVQVSQSSGVSGAGIRIDIRGRNSLRNTNTNNGNLPLYIVDGVPITSSSLDALSNVGSQILPQMSPLNTINPNDIESIEILKDADATAIYGSRGANGVVLITTKKGRVGKTKVDINFYTGAGKVTRTMDLLNSEQYMQMRREAYKNDGVIIPASANDLNGKWDTTRYTDWQKLLIGGTANTTNLQASLSGGNSNTQFRLGMGYFKQTTVFPGDFSDQKLSGHLNLNHSSENKRFTAATTFSFVNDVNNLPASDPTIQALVLAPVAPKVYNDDGTLNWQNNTWTNPLARLKQPYSAITNNLVINSNLAYEIITGLTLKTSFGYTNTQSHLKNLTLIAGQNPAFSPLGSAIFSENSFSSWLAEPQIEYQKSIGHSKLITQVGATFQQNISQFQSVNAVQYTTDALIENLASAGATFPSSSYLKYRYSAVFGRINYNYNDKYLINLTGRRDGSSRFGPGKQFANFGAIGLGWIFSNEQFIARSLPFISFGKFRGSYGITGSDQIPDYGYRDAYTSVTGGYNGNTGLSVNRLYNPDYRWEENKKTEFAVELGFAKNRIYTTASFFRNRSSNQLVGYPLPTITGQSSLPFYNLPATVQNTGWEFEIRTVNINAKSFRWSSSANLTIPKNKLISYPGLASSSNATTYVVGESIYGRRVFQFDGVNPQTGLFTFLDVDRDGRISSPSDLAKVKNISSQYFGGVQNSFSFKGFNLDFLIQFVKQTSFNYITIFGSPGQGANQPTKVLSRWQQPGDVTEVQRYSATGAGTTNFNLAVSSGENRISDASFIRLKNVSLSYGINSKILEKAHITSFRVYVQAQNLLTITNYLGLDPETQSFQNIPPLKMVTAGIQVTL